MLLTSLFCLGKMTAGAEHTSNSGCHSRQTSGFFSSMVFHGRVARLPKNSLRAKAAGRLLAVFKYLAAPLNRGRTLNLPIGAIMAKTSYDGMAVARAAIRDAAHSLQGLLSLLEDRGDFTANGEQLAALLVPIMADVVTVKDELEYPE